MMYWTDWGVSPAIEWAGMDGSLRRKLVDTRLVWPNSLAIDFESRKLFWTDAGLKHIEFSNMDGSQRTVSISTSVHTSQ